MYRIMQARNGYYYVQRDFGSTYHADWSRVSPFYPTKSGARAYIDRQKSRRCSCGHCPTTSRVIEYR